MRTLTKEQAEDLINYVDEHLVGMCKGSSEHIEKWIEDNIPEERHSEVFAELYDKGILCHCDLMYYGLD